MSFKLSNRSLAKMEGVDESLVAVVKRAIELTKVDFGVIYGLRTVEEQKKLACPALGSIQYTAMIWAPCVSGCFHQVANRAISSSSR